MAKTHTLKYQFFHNRAEDEKGRSLGRMDGFETGHALCLCHEGEISGTNYIEILDALYYRFNEDRMRVPEYRGPSMSKGDVITLDLGDDNLYGRTAHAVDSFGFKWVDITESEILPADPRWTVSA